MNDALDDTHAFKNFHRALCERFDYCHDERDWRRDQVSLIEHIFKKQTLPAEAVRQPLTCIWTKDFDGPFDTSCGNAFQFTDDGIEENDFKFCCYCGGAIEAGITGAQE